MCINRIMYVHMSETKRYIHRCTCAYIIKYIYIYTDIYCIHVKDLLKSPQPHVTTYTRF